MVAVLRVRAAGSRDPGGGGLAGAADAAYRWIVDPLDGTTNFIHGVPTFAVSVGLEDASGLVAGASTTRAATRPSTRTAAAARSLNGARIACTGLDHLDAALIATGFPSAKWTQLPAYLAAFERFVRSTSGLRRAGSASLDLAYTACGRYDGFFEVGLNPGTWPAARSSSWRRAASSPMSAAARGSCGTGRSSPRGRGFTPRCWRSRGETL